MKGARLLAFGGTDEGRERKNNEDRFLCDKDRGIFAVVDGVGGESGGEVAASLAVEALRGRLSRRTTETRQLLREAIALANAQIYDYAGKNPLFKGMSCVLTVAVLDGDRLTIGHVGDSRLYALSRGRIEKVTRDHSPIGIREDRGEISEAEAMQHPRRNEILRDVGSAPHQPDDPDFIDFYERQVTPESAFLICSDGLSDMVPSEEIRAVVERHAGDPQAAVEELIDAANEHGGKDNVSVVVLLGERYAASLKPARAPRRAAASPAATAPLAWQQEPSIALKEAGPPPKPVALQGAASVPGRAIPWSLLSVLGVLAVGLVLFFLFREPILHQLARLRGTASGPAADAQVKPGESIQAALDAASPGDTVELLPGEYAGPVRLHDGVALVCRSAQRAVIHAGAGAPGATVQAEGLRQRTLLSGVRIEAANAPRSVALALTDSNVELVDAEIVGGTEAGVSISGAAARPLLEASHVHGNRGAGVVLRDGAAPRLRANLIAGNGTVAPLRPGVEICESCLPSLVDNRFLDNGGPALRLLASGPGAAEFAAELFGWNSFLSAAGAVPREKAVVAGAGTHP